MDLRSARPLPPIGSQDLESNDVAESEERSNIESNSTETNRSRITEHGDDDMSSVSRASSTNLHRAETGRVRPRIMQKFRRDTRSSEEEEMGADSSEEEADEKSQRMTRTVSFIEAREKSTKTPPPPREMSHKSTYDGRDVVVVSMDTQTDWDWVKDMELKGHSRPATATDGKSIEKGDWQSSGTQLKSESGGAADSLPDDKTVSGATSFTAPYSDEFGIPMLDLSSDTDDSSDEEASTRKTKDDRDFMPSVGPPQILQYIRESEKKEIKVEEPESRLPAVQEDEDLPKDSQGKTQGMFSGTCEFCLQPIRAFPTLEQQLQLPPEMLYCCVEYREFVEFALNTTEILEKENEEKKKMISIKPHEHHGTKQERTAAKEKAVQKMRQRELERRAIEASGMQQNFFAFARQMKTINYQLSSQKCLDEGWTLRAPSPLSEDLGDDVFVPEPLNPAMIADGRLRDRHLIEKFYENGQKFLTIFPDGTGNVFYPSGNLAILISSIKLGQYNYTIHEDVPRSVVIASFDPNGHGYCYFPDGALRLYIDQYGGVELDRDGGRKRRWTWKEDITHVHAPPFQPICLGLGMGRNLGLRVMTQENISLTFSAQCRSCRFNMGARLKVVAPENVPPKEILEDLIFLKEKKNTVESLLNKVSNLLKFPNSPKIDRILPPLHVTTKIQKTDKLKEERKLLIAAQTARDNKKLPPVTAS